MLPTTLSVPAWVSVITDVLVADWYQVRVLVLLSKKFHQFVVPAV